MNRMELINIIAEHIGAKNYLEVGVRFGACLSGIRAPNRVGVDPQPMLHEAKPEHRPGLEGVTLYLCTSDEYFAKASERFDLVFVDGMHLYEFAMRDLLNALNLLRPGGFVVMHDMCPRCAAVAGRCRTSTEWNGDVWKVSLDVHLHYPDIGFFVADTDFGLGVFWKRNPETVYPVRWDRELPNLGFDLYEKNAQKFQPRIDPTPEALRRKLAEVC
ncbi:MAG: class I SAM-dependent methyltransferase [Desulfovibrio sp.]